jgi:hypothetical protein
MTVEGSDVLPLSSGLKALKVSIVHLDELSLFERILPHTRIEDG